jgi:hypothetical protein
MENWGWNVLFGCAVGCGEINVKRRKRGHYPNKGETDDAQDKTDMSTHKEGGGDGSTRVERS